METPIDGLILDDPKAALANQLFMDLKCAKNWKDLSIIENKELGIYYVQGKLGQEDSHQLIFPHHVKSSLSMLRLNDIFQKNNISTINLAFIDSDSSITYYQVYSSLVPPKL